jgi:hypothetical protein
MLDLNWANEQHPQGYTKEQIEAERQRQAQASQAALQAELRDVDALRARAEQLMAALVTGPHYATLKNVLIALDGAATPAHRVVAARSLRAVVEHPDVQTSARLAVDMEHRIAPARAAEAQRQVAEAAKPKPLTVEERLARIEKHLGIE